MYKSLSSVLPLLLLSSPALAQNAPQPPTDTSKGLRGENVPAFWIREGYRVDLAAKDFGEARFLETDGKGTVFVSQPGKGNLIALTDKDNDGVYENAKTLITARPKLHGLHFYDGLLYFTTPRGIFRINPAEPATVKTIATFEVGEDGGHWWRSICVTPDAIYTSIGDPGNLTDVGDSPREKIWKLPFNPATGEAGTPELFVTGIRNTEKLRLRPGTSELYGCDHGSDNFGARYGEKGGGPITDVLPPCEFNHYIQGFDYGHPFITGIGLPRPEFATRPDILDKVDKNTPPAWMFGAHWAPNGWTFVAQDKLVPKGDALIALHGSWNARRKTGYRIEHICFDPATNRPFGAQTLVGTLDDAGNKPLARPVDCLELPDGSILFSDDNGQKLYRLSKTTK